MDYDVTRAEDIDFDLEVVFDFLVASVEAFGESEEAAFSLAERRIAEIEVDMVNLGRVPHQGTLRPHLGIGIRNVTKGRAVFYFHVDDVLKEVRILAVFYGDQDHQSDILVKMLSRA